MVVRETDKVTSTSMMKDVVEVTTLSVNISNNLRERERERERDHNIMKDFPRK